MKSGVWLTYTGWSHTLDRALDPEPPPFLAQPAEAYKNPESVLLEPGVPPGRDTDVYYIIYLFVILLLFL